ncbi:MAG: metallophosphoesterase [Holophagales bacterium]|nr:metallophosphoesterase [Holophagales bacterium]
MSHRIPEDSAKKTRRHLDSRHLEKLQAHKGKATLGERLVPLGEFRQAVLAHGRALAPEERAAARDRYLAPKPDPTPVEGPFSRIVVFGGIYNNSYGLEAMLHAAREHRAEAAYCLGDFGGFGPDPEKVWPLLEQGGVRSIQGNYEASLASGREDCNCGYADPRDNYYADLSYRYTAERCSPEFKAWMGTHPQRRRVSVGDKELLLVHGSPRQVNEFLFASTSPDPFLEVLLDQEQCDAILCTHTGLHWHRRLPSGRDVVNVGVLGRPANDGHTHVWYAVLDATRGGSGLGIRLLPLRYDHRSLARDMRREELPEPFVETILTGWWTTCLEILPARERAASRY